MSTDTTVPVPAASSPNPFDAVMDQLKDAIKTVSLLYADNVARRVSTTDPATPMLEKLQNQLIDLLTFVSAARASTADVKNALLSEMGKELLANFQAGLLAAAKQSDDSAIQMRQVTAAALKNSLQPTPAGAAT